MKDTFRDLITFSAGERKGIIVLILVVMLIGGFNLLLNRQRPAPGQEEYPEWMRDSGILTVPEALVEPEKDSFHEQPPEFAFMQNEPFFIDPNDASIEDLLRLGLSLRVCRTIVNYRSKGGRFTIPADLKRIFGMSPSQYARISTHIRIRPGPAMYRKESMTGRPAGYRLLDINHADSVLLEKLPGIGPVLATRIIKYRSLLGGYYSIHQLKEVYGISDSLFLHIAARLDADTTVLTRINLNTATEKEIARHPYIGRFTASGIIRYRMQVSRIKNIDELKINGLVSGDVFDKIKNYLSV